MLTIYLHPSSLQTGILNEDLLMEYTPSYTNIRIARNKKQSNKTKIARRGEGLNSKPIRIMKKKSRIENRSKKVYVQLKIKGV